MSAMTLQQARDFYATFTNRDFDPQTIEGLKGQCEMLHAIVCSAKHMPGCADPDPPDDDWNGWVSRLASLRAAAWRMTVFVALLKEDPLDHHDQDTWTADKMPPDTTSHLYRKQDFNPAHFHYPEAAQVLYDYCGKTAKGE